MSELEQTKKVLDVIANLINEKETCTYRHLIYDLLGFKEDAYSELISGLTITNFLVYVKEQDKEIERLNNIINELEKWLKERLEKLDINGFDDDIFNGLEFALNKLRELKGSEKSES